MFQVVVLDNHLLFILTLKHRYLNISQIMKLNPTEGI